MRKWAELAALIGSGFVVYFIVRMAVPDNEWGPLVRVVSAAIIGAFVGRGIYWWHEAWR